MSKVVVFEATTAAQLAAALAIRHQVFVQEQQVPQELELELEQEATTYLAYLEQLAVGCARWRIAKPGWAKVERCAVLPNYRNQAIGSLLVKTLLAALPTNLGVYLHAQLPAVAFYQRLGFVAHGEVFEEAGIQHVRMVWREPVSRQ